MPQAGGIAAAWEHSSCQNGRGGMTGDEACGQPRRTREETFQSSSTGCGILDAWWLKTTDEPEAMSIYDMTMQASGLSFATRRYRRLRGMPRYLVPFR